MSAGDRRYTVTEFHTLVDDTPDGEKYLELFNGEIIEKALTQIEGLIAVLIGGVLFEHLQRNPIGWALLKARYEMPNDPEHSLIPDLSFVLKEGRELVAEGAAPYMPEMVIEVQSPKQGGKVLAAKANYYLANGCRMVWLVYPKQRVVEVVTSDDRDILTENDVLNGGEVLPGFTLAVREIFPPPETV